MREGNIEVKFPEGLQSGVYANNTVIAHTKEEFVMDFMFVAPPMGSVNARVIVSPGHMKRIISALQDNIAKYEEAFGKIEEAAGPKTSFGFQP